MKKITKNLFLAASFVIAASSSLSAQSLIAGWDFNNTNPLADPGAYQADVFGSATSFLNTTSFQQPSTPGGGGTAFDFNAQYVGFGDIGSIPTGFAANNGFSADPFDVYFQGPIDGISWNISLDVSNFVDIQFQFDSFSSNTSVISGGTLSYQLDGGSFSTVWDSGNSNVSFGQTYAASDLYTLDVSGANSLNIAFEFNSTETATFGLSDRAYFDNIAVGGTVVPEPSTYAAIFGVLALVFVAYRRRRP